MSSPGRGDAASPIVAYPGTRTGGGGSELKRSVSEATRKIEQIVDAAEQVAHEIRAEAEAEASGYLEQRRLEADRLVQERTGQLAETVRPVVQRVERLREQTAEVARELERAIDSMRHLSSPEPAPTEPARSAASRPDPGSAARPAPALGVVEPVDAARPATPPAPTPGETRSPDQRQADGSSIAAEARLRATQMAIAGSSRDEITVALRSDFGIADPAQIVDEILGLGY